MNPYIDDSFFEQLTTYSLQLKKDLRGFFGGRHLTSMYGQTVEFADYREYTPGDDIRRLDWNLYSRFEKYFIKQFIDERQMHIKIVLDCSASMGEVSKNKANFSMALASGLGYLAINNMDKISFSFIQDDKVFKSSDIITGKNTFYRYISEMNDIVFEKDSCISESLMNSNFNGNKDGLTIIISDFLTDNDYKEAISLLASNSPVLVIQLLDILEVNPNYDGRVNLIDSETSQDTRLRITSKLHESYNETLNILKNELSDFCVSNGASFISTDTSKSVIDTILKDVMKVGVVK